MRHPLALLVLVFGSACQVPGLGGQAPTPRTAPLEALGAPPYCEQSEGPVGFPTFGCEGVSDDPCVVVGCFDGMCRQGSLFPGCCATDAACDEPSKLSVCNGFHGRCQAADGQPAGWCDYSPDADHPGCCLSTVECILRMLAGQVLEPTGQSCASDAECANVGPLGGACRDGFCVRRCDPSACLAGPCNAEGLVPRTYPRYGGSCHAWNARDPDGQPYSGDEWRACDYQPQPSDDCHVDSTSWVSPVVLNEVMIAPLAVDDALGEWVELVNTTEYPINLAGWYVGAWPDSALIGDAQRIAPSDACARIEPNGTFVVCRGSADPTVNGGVPCDAVMASPDAWSLPDEGGSIAVWAPGSQAPQPVDDVSYSADQVVPGVSLVLSHPYADQWEWTDAKWVTNGGLERLPYNDVDRGTPGSLNLDVQDPAFDADPRQHVFCADLDPCTLDVCAPARPNNCDHYPLNCGGGPECDTDADCTGAYPPDLDVAVDVAEPFGVVDPADAEAVRARFDEVMSKPCVQHACQFRKRPDAPHGCVAATYGRPDLDCHDYNPCTADRCTCNADDPTLCADGDPSNGYFACDYSEPVVPGEVCCNENADCPDDGDPNTIESCQQYRCERHVKPCYCVGPEDCTAATACEVAGCIECTACTYEPDPAKPGCCTSHADCRRQEVDREGRNLVTTLNVCCRDDEHSIDDDPALDALCVGVGDTAGYPRCISADAPGTCDQPADCELPIGQRCLTPYCVAHRCRPGPPATDGDPGTPGVQACCDLGEGATAGAGSCDDDDPCTLDACVDAGAAPLGTCVHSPDPGAPGCCSDDEGCASDDPCTRAVCRIHGDAPYPTCDLLDLGALGLCCAVDGDCYDGDPCTAEWCVDRLCRSWKPDPACCLSAGDCPPTGDACAKKTCSFGACTLEPTANCIVNLPYEQDFEFGVPFYDQALVTPDTVSWEVSGAEAGAWVVTDAPENGEPWSRHLRFAPGFDAAPVEPACVELPDLNTLGLQSVGIGLVFRHALHGTGGQPGLVLTVQARNRVTEGWEPLWTLDAPGDEEAREVEVLVPPNTTERAFLGVSGSPLTHVRFCAEAPSLPAGVGWALDDVVVARGRPPAIEVLPGSLAVSRGADVHLARLKAVDPDLDVVGFALSGAPGFVALTTTEGSNTTTVDLRAMDAECDGSGAAISVFSFRVRASDGALFTDVSFVLTVTDCAPAPGE